MDDDYVSSNGFDFRTCIVWHKNLDAFEVVKAQEPKHENPRWKF